MICVQCGKDNDEGNKFCSACGAKLPEISLDTAASDIIEEGAPVEETVEGSLNDSVSDAEETVTQAASDFEDTVDNAFDEMKGDTGSYSSSNVYDEDQPGKPGFAIGSLVCGCLSIICCCMCCFGFPLSIAAIALGVVCLMKNFEGRGLAIGGIATGGVGILLQIIFAIAAYSNDLYSEIFGAF